VVVVASEIDIRLAVIARFPGLQNTPFELTSPHDEAYNCIAWAAGDNQNFWWPTATWPNGVSRNVTMTSFVSAFKKLGYRVCQDGEPEQGYEKIALYHDDKQPTHAARLLPNGRWTSKLGRFVDISHSLEGLNGVEYGEPKVFMRRPSPDF